MKYEKQLEAAGYFLEDGESTAVRPFNSVVRTGNLLFVSGHAAKTKGKLMYQGIVGANVSPEQAKRAAEIAFVNCLQAVKREMGSLDTVVRIVNMKGYIASTPEFIGQPQVMDAASELANKVFGDAGKHSRVALGMASLPGGTPVEIELVIEVRE